MTGVFYLPQSRALTLKFLQPPAGQWASAYLFIDRQQVLGGPLSEQTLRNTSRIELAKGIHHLEILARDYLRQSKCVVGYETDDGTLRALAAGLVFHEGLPRDRGLPQAEGNAQDRGRCLGGHAAGPAAALAENAAGIQ